MVRGLVALLFVTGTQGLGRPARIEISPRGFVALRDRVARGVPFRKFLTAVQKARFR